MSHTFRQFAVGIAAGLLVLSAASAGFAQSGGTPTTARDVLLLVTERMSVEGEDKQRESFWWSRPSAPQWTETDASVRDGLEQMGVDLIEPSGKERVSKVYRQPSLSTSNAASLGSILDAKHVVVGTVTYERRAPIEALGLRRVSARVDLELVSADSSDTTPLHRFTLSREAFEDDDASALEEARGQTTEALVDVLGETLMRGPGPVGVDSEETHIGLRNAGNARTVEQITDFLTELDPIDEVGVRWASEGLIALEVNPDKRDSSKVIERATRALRAESFDDFSLQEGEATDAEGLTEFRVTDDRDSESR